MLTLKERNDLDEIIDAALDRFGERLREIVREELRACGYAMRHRLSPPAAIPCMPMKPISLAESLGDVGLGKMSGNG